MHPALLLVLRPLWQPQWRLGGLLPAAGASANWPAIARGRIGLRWLGAVSPKWLFDSWCRPVDLKLVAGVVCTEELETTHYVLEVDPSISFVL